MRLRDDMGGFLEVDEKRVGMGDLMNIVENLNNEFKRLEYFRLIDYSDLDMVAEENLNACEYKRFTRMLNRGFKNI